MVLVLLAGGLASKPLATKMKDLFKNQKTAPNSNSIVLPLPRFDSQTSIEKAILGRRSIRDYKDEPLTLAEVSQLLWAAQGVTDNENNFRTAPSAGALYPLEVYVVAGKVENFSPGFYKYQPKNHKLIKITEGDKRNELCQAALSQPSVREAPVTLVFSAVYERTTAKYGEKGKTYVHMEVGHAAENVYLQAVSLNLGTVVIGAFDDEKVKEIMKMPANETPLYLLPVGKK